MARGRRRPRKQAPPKRLSPSSSSAKGSASSSIASQRSTGPQTPEPTILENEVLSPRASLVQLQHQSLYSNWSAALNGHNNGGQNMAQRTSRVSSGTVPLNSLPQAKLPQPHTGHLEEQCKAGLAKKWVPKAPVAMPCVVNEDGFQLVVSRRVAGKRPMHVVSVAPAAPGGSTSHDDIPLCTSNGFELLAEVDCSSKSQGHITDIALGAHPIPPDG
ncbi:unnamed protein product [Amaranthus hypochondriacus]